MGFVLVMEFVPLSLWEFLRDPRYQLNLSQSKKYMKMLLLGLAHMHELNLMHRVIFLFNFKYMNKGYSLNILLF